MYICLCSGITDSELVEEIKNNKITSFEEFVDVTEVASVCGQCLKEAERVWNDFSQLDNRIDK